MSDAEPEATPVEDLLVRARTGEPGALNELLQRFRPFMTQIAARAAEFGSYDRSDLVQDAQMQVFSRIVQFRGKTTGEFCQWLRRIICNKGVDHIRRHHDVDRLPETSSGDVQVSESQSSGITGEELDELRKAIAKLPPRWQEVIYLRDLEEQLTDVEIASILDTTPANVRTLHSRAVKRLGELLRGSDK